MSDDTTPRLALPLLAAGQAQKEMYHNEALLGLDALVQPSVQGAPQPSPPAAPAAGQCWIVASSATGEWAGQDGAIACWSGAGWRFVAPFEGLAAWRSDIGEEARYRGGAWTFGVLAGEELRIAGMRVIGTQQPAITAPSGGTTVDSEARSVLQSVLLTLRTHGLIAPI